MLLTANENRILVIEITFTDADGLLRNFSRRLLCCSSDVFRENRFCVVLLASFFDSCFRHNVRLFEIFCVS